MGALGTLGIGLSVLFGLFLAVLAGEIYYMLCCRRGRLGGGSNSRRVSSVQVVEAQAAAAAAATEMGGFVREAAMVGSFGGYPSNPYQSEFVSKFFPPSVDCTHISPFDGILFTIAEETKEEMELHAGNVKYPDSPLLSDLTSDVKPVVDTLSPITGCSSVIISMTEASACASSTSLSTFSVTPEGTPFATPPSSPSASDTSSDDSLSSLASPATAASRFSAHSCSPASASSSPATAASRFSICSLSPSSMTGSPATANSRFSVTSPISIAVSPAAATRFQVHTPVSTSSASQRSSVDATYVYGDHGPLGALFRRSYNSPSRYSPLRPMVWSGQITDFRHALPFSPSNAQVFMNC